MDFRIVGVIFPIGKICRRIVQFTPPIASNPFAIVGSPMQGKSWGVQ
jgi:hypothetical protein